MKKNLSIIYIFCFILVWGQNIDYTTFNLTTPTISGMASYVKSPISLSTGIPEIKIPLLSLPTHHKGLIINSQLSYHPNNTLMGRKSSDVGIGWSLDGVTGVIYREINSNNGYPESIYYFNLFGKTGKFAASNKDGNSSVEITKQTMNQLQISGTEINGLWSFTIVDEMGNKYFFDNRDISYYSKSNPVSSENYTGAYYLSRVENNKGFVILSLDYTEDNYTVKKYPGMSQQIPVKSLKVNKITSPDFGTLNFSYTFNQALTKSYKDPFQLDNIELKTTAGKLVEKYIFEYDEMMKSYPFGYIFNPVSSCGMVQNESHRRLIKVKKISSDNKIDKIEMEYPFDNTFFDQNYQNYWTDHPLINNLHFCFEKEYENPKYLGQGLLKSIVYSTGTKVMYTFEPNQYYVDKNNSDYIKYFAPPYEVKDREAQYYEDIGLFSFDFHSPNPGVSLGMFNLSYNPDQPDGASYLNFYVNVDEYYTDDPTLPTNPNLIINGQLDGGTNGEGGYKKYMPGRNGFSISGTGGRGTILIKRIRYKSMPLPNYNTGGGVRIKKIEFYDNNSLVESQTKYYKYQKFGDVTTTSGFMLNADHSQTVAYKNVKEIQGNNKGYTKYYFKTLDDDISNSTVIKNIKDSLFTFIDSTNINPQPSPDFQLKFVNIFKDGLLYKKEIFDKNNNLIAKDSTNFDFQNTSVYDMNYQVPLFPNQTTLQTFLTGQSGIIKKQITSSTLYNPSGILTQTSEVTRDVNDYNVTYKKNIGTDGNITEEFITYPFQYQSTSPKLWNAHIKDIPMVTENKLNGVTVSKSETKFEDLNHYFPTSSLYYLPDNLSQSVKNVSYEIYDVKGNLVQFTTFPDVGGVGKPTTIIWGYHQTVPIAKIEGAKLSDIPASLITSIVNASNTDADAVTSAQETSAENTLVDELNLFRTNTALKDYMISCYTYNPLIGVTKMIPPTGLMEIYNYDSFNRLMNVKDVNGVILKEYEYNYKH